MDRVSSEASGKVAVKPGKVVVMPDIVKQAAAIKIQARLRGNIGRKRAQGRGADGGSAILGVTIQARHPNHPTDRELIGQKAARLRHKKERGKYNVGDLFAESSFDGASTSREVVLNKKAMISVPSPGGVNMPMGLNNLSNMRLAFRILDVDTEQVLHRSQARAWLRALGWCLSNSVLDDMLDGQRGHDKRHAMHKDKPEVWGLKHLIEVAEENSHLPNSSVDDLEASLLRLTNGRPKISRNRLTEITMANGGFIHDNLKVVFEAIGVRPSGCTETRQLAMDVLTRITQPPPSVQTYDLKG